MKSLFNDFEGVSAKQWKQKIQMDLQGADYNDTLVWQSLEGIHVKPFYHQDETNATPIPGHPKRWNIGQHVFIDDAKIANKLALDAINRGADAIFFAAEAEFDIDVVFNNFSFQNIKIYFEFSFLAETFYNRLQSFLNSKDAIVFYNVDLLKQLTSNGNWFHSLKQDHEILEKLVTKNLTENIISVDTSVYQNAGANIVQQLAYGLAHANEYLNHFCATKPIPSFSINFQVAAGSNYFFEIAKIRALRLLYATLASDYGIKEICAISAKPTKRNKTLYDYNVNMLRTTTECMSAILGGADTIVNLPYDAIYHKSNEFGERIARNQLLILKEESYFDMVSNPSDGSYYIESLTNELAEKALTLFKNIERSGGFLSQLKDGVIQKKIKESAAKEQTLFDEGTLKLVGTNFQQNENDRMKEDIELYPFLKHNPRKTAIEPIVEKRIAEIIEQERLNHE